MDGGAPTTQSVTGLVRDLGRMLEEFATQDPQSARPLLVTAAEELFQVLDGIERTLALNVDRRSAPSAASTRVRELIDIIERRYVEPLQIRTLARQLCRSPAHLASEFRRQTGFTIHRYLTHVRMRHAAEMLQRGDKVEAVMLLVGYNSKKSFYSNFRTHTGQTPGGFRRRLPS